MEGSLAISKVHSKNEEWKKDIAEQMMEDRQKLRSCLQQETNNNYQLTESINCILSCLRDNNTTPDKLKKSVDSMLPSDSNKPVFIELLDKIKGLMTRVFDMESYSQMSQDSTGPISREDYWGMLKQLATNVGPSKIDILKEIAESFQELFTETNERADLQDVKEISDIKSIIEQALAVRDSEMESYEQMKVLADEQIAVFKKENKEMRINIDELLGDKNDAEARVDTLVLKNEELEKTCQQQDSELKILRESFTACNADLIHARTKWDNARKGFSNSEEEIKERLYLVEEDLQKSEVTLKNMREKYEYATERAVESEEKCRKSVHKLELSQKLVSQLKHDLLEFQQKENDSSNSVDTLQHTLDLKSANLKKLEASIEHLKTQNNDMKTQIVDSIKHQENLRQSRDELITRTKGDTETMCQLNESNERMKKELNELKKRNECLSTEYNDLQKQYSNKSSEMDILQKTNQATLKQLRDSTDELRNSQENHQMKVLSIQHQLKEVERRASESESSFQQVDTARQHLRERVDEMQTMLITLQQDKATHATSASLEMSALRCELEAQVNQANNRVNRLSKELTEIVKERDGLSLENERMKQKLTAQPDESEAIETLNRKYESISREIEEKNKLICDLQASLEASKTREDSLQKQLGDVHLSFKNVSGELSSKNAELEALGGIQMNLRKEVTDLRMKDVERAQSLKSIEFENNALRKDLQQWEREANTIATLQSKVVELSADASGSLELRAKVESLMRENANLMLRPTSEEMETLHREIESRSRQLDKASERADDNHTRLQQHYENELKRLTQALTTADESSSTLHNKMMTLQTELSTSKRKLESVSREKAQMDNELKCSQTLLEGTEKKLGIARAEVTSSRSELNMTLGELESLKKRFFSLNQESVGGVSVGGRPPLPPTTINSNIPFPSTPALMDRTNTTSSLASGSSHSTSSLALVSTIATSAAYNVPVPVVTAASNVFITPDKERQLMRRSESMESEPATQEDVMLMALSSHTEDNNNSNNNNNNNNNTTTVAQISSDDRMKQMQPTTEQQPIITIPNEEKKNIHEDNIITKNMTQKSQKGNVNGEEDMELDEVQHSDNANAKAHNERISKEEKEKEQQIGSEAQTPATAVLDKNGFNIVTDTNEEKVNDDDNNDDDNKVGKSDDEQKRMTLTDELPPLPEQPKKPRGRPRGRATRGRRTRGRGRGRGRGKVASPARKTAPMTPSSSGIQDKEISKPSTRKRRRSLSLEKTIDDGDEPGNEPITDIVDSKTTTPKYKKTLIDDESSSDDEDTGTIPATIVSSKNKSGMKKRPVHSLESMHEDEYGEPPKKRSRESDGSSNNNDGTTKEQENESTIPQSLDSQNHEDENLPVLEQLLTNSPISKIKRRSLPPPHANVTPTPTPTPTINPPTINPPATMTSTDVSNASTTDSSKSNNKPAPSKKRRMTRRSTQQSKESNITTVAKQIEKNQQSEKEQKQTNEQSNGKKDQISEMEIAKTPKKRITRKTRQTPAQTPAPAQLPTEDKATPRKVKNTIAAATPQTAAIPKSPVHVGASRVDRGAMPKRFHIICTAIDAKARYDSIARKLGAKVSNSTSWDKTITHVVTGSGKETTFARTKKTLCARVSSGVWIIKPAWLDDCEAKNEFVDETPFGSQTPADVNLCGLVFAKDKSFVDECKQYKRTGTIDDIIKAGGGSWKTSRFTSAPRDFTLVGEKFKPKNFNPRHKRNINLNWIDFLAVIEQKSENRITWKSPFVDNDDDDNDDNNNDDDKVDVNDNISKKSTEGKPDSINQKTDERHDIKPSPASTTKTDEEQIGMAVTPKRVPPKSNKRRTPMPAASSSRKVQPRRSSRIRGNSK